MPTLDSTAVLRAVMLLYYVAQCSIALPVAAGARRRQWLSPALRVMWHCCLMWLVLMAGAEISGKLWHYNIAVYDLVDILELWFIGTAYHYILRFNLRRYFLLIGIAYTAFGLLDAFLLHGLLQPITYTVVIKSALIIGLAMLYFEQTLRDLRNITLERDPMFVVSVALLLYYAGSVVMFVFRNSQTDKDDFLLIDSINSVLNLVMHLLLSRAFWLAGRAQKAAFEPTPVSASHMQV